jgi:hypothetical protein
MKDYFGNPEKIKKYFDFYQEEIASGEGPGAYIIIKDPWDDLRGECNSYSDWFSAEKLNHYSGSLYDNTLKKINDKTAYIILLILMTGDSGVPEDMTSPKMKTRSCLLTITKVDDTKWNTSWGTSSPLYDTVILLEEEDEDEYEEEEEEDEEEKKT